MDHNNNNRAHRIHVAPSSPSPPPSPPLVSFVTALAVAIIIFMCIYVFSTIVSVAILFALYITSFFLCRFIHDRHELDIEMGERNTFYAQTPQNNQRVVRVLDRPFWVVEERESQRQQRSVEKLQGTVVRFGTKEMASCSSDCAICLEDFKNGEECLVFPICGHLFHLICINHWLENKPTCPICRFCIPSKATMITKNRSIDFLEISV